MSLDSNPDARLYYLAARQRFEDAEVLLPNRRTNGSIYLAGFAVECILKALILANSTSKERPKLADDLKRRFGHDLEALRKEAARRGLHMPRDERDAFRRVNTWDNNRYETRLQSTRDAEVLLAAARVVIQWARKSGGSSDG